MRTTWKLILALGLAGLAAAQTPAVNAGGIVNVASYALAVQPNGAIARGSMVTIFGTNMGPSTLQQAGAYPLPTSLGGTSIKITSGTTLTDAILNYTSAGQITAIVPSATPVGAATMVVTYNGKSSAPAAFTVVNSSFGIFAANSGGSGPGIVATGAGNIFGLTSAANPGDVGVIWGTGLGPVTGNEAAGALPGDLTALPVEVNVGGVTAPLLYRGRSGCCAAVDQISFTVPNVVGCRVPVSVRIGTIVSNTITMAIAPAGTRSCTDTGGPSATDQQRFSVSGASVAQITLNRTNTTILLAQSAPSLGTTTLRNDIATATFFKYTAAQLNAARNPFNTPPPVGTCSVSALSGLSASVQTYADSLLPGDPIAAVSLDAGASISVVGPAGTKTLLKGRDSIHPTGTPAYYSGYLAGAPETTNFLEPGVVTVSGAGGKDVGAFQTTITVPAILKWTNADSVAKVNRSAGQLVTWTGGDPAGTVSISGTSVGPGNAITNLSGASFSCTARVSDGQFEVPASILLAMPINASNSNILGFQYGRMQVGTNTATKGFTASGIDFASSIATLDAEKLVDYQ